MTDLPSSGSDGGGRPTPNEKPTRVELRQAHMQGRNTISCLEKAMSEHGIMAFKIQEQVSGTDYWFSDRTHALDLVQFIEGVVPVKKKSDDDGVSATFFSLHILPVCPNDLILGSGDNNFFICTEVSAHGISLTGTSTLTPVFLTAEAYWREPCTVLMFGCDLMAEYLVLDIVRINPPVAHYCLADAHYCLADAHIVRVSDLGKKTDGHKKLLVRTHLGCLLKPGDYVLGYDVAGDVILVPSSQGLPIQLSSPQQIHGQLNGIGDIQQQQQGILLNFQQMRERCILNMQKDLNQQLVRLHQLEQELLGTSEQELLGHQGSILVLKQMRHYLAGLLSSSLQREMDPTFDSAVVGFSEAREWGYLLKL